MSHTERTLERATEQLAVDAPNLNRPPTEAALVRAQKSIKVANNAKIVLKSLLSLQEVYCNMRCEN